MSALAKPAFEEALKIVPGTNRASRAFLDDVIEKMVRVQSERGTGVFAFTAPNRNTGTTHVVNLVAEELTRRYHCRVAVLPTAALRDTQPCRIPQGFLERSPGIWTAASNRELQYIPDFALENVWVSPAVQDFDFILADCPALVNGPQALGWTRAANGVFLVVAEISSLEQIEEAQSVLEDHGSRVEGVVLNRRSFPVSQSFVC